MKTVFIFTLVLTFSTVVQAQAIKELNDEQTNWLQINAQFHNQVTTKIKAAESLIVEFTLNPLGLQPTDTTKGRIQKLTNNHYQVVYQQLNIELVFLKQDSALLCKRFCFLVFGKLAFLKGYAFLEILVNPGRQNTKLIVKYWMREGTVEDLTRLTDGRWSDKLEKFAGRLAGADKYLQRKFFELGKYVKERAEQKK